MKRVVISALHLKRIFLSSIQLIDQMMRETVKPPSHRPVTVSSTPSHRDRPTPVLTATVQTGQIACAFTVKPSPITAAAKMTIFPLFIAFIHRAQV